jgi:hypothetical protein
VSVLVGRDVGTAQNSAESVAISMHDGGRPFPPFLSQLDMGWKETEILSQVFARIFISIRKLGPVHTPWPPPGGGHSMLESGSARAQYGSLLQL